MYRKVIAALLTAALAFIVTACTDGSSSSDSGTIDGISSTESETESIADSSITSFDLSGLQSTEVSRDPDAPFSLQDYKGGRYEMKIDGSMPRTLTVEVNGRQLEFSFDSGISRAVYGDITDVGNYIPVYDKTGGSTVFAAFMITENEVLVVYDNDPYPFVYTKAE